MKKLNFGMNSPVFSTKTIVYLTVCFWVVSLWPGTKPVLIDAIKEPKRIIIRTQIQKGFGIQQKAENAYKIYSLKKGHEKIGFVKDKIKKAAQLEGQITKLSGETAKEDPEYFSRVNELKWPTNLDEAKKYDPGKEYLIESVLYYCSFSAGFCNVVKDYTYVK